MNNVIAIIGAGGHAKCVYECLVMKGHRVIGFFDDDDKKKNLTLIDGVKVLGSPEEIAAYEEVTAIFVALGDNKKRLDKYRYYAKKQYTLPSAIHDRAYVSGFAVMGQGNFLMGSALVNPASRIGDYCIINSHATVGHDCVLEDGVQIGPGVNVAGACILKEGVFVGIGAKIAPEVTIGEWAVIGAGAVVLHDVPAGVFACGIPATINAGQAD